MESIKAQLEANIAETRAVQEQMDGLSAQYNALQAEWFRLAGQLPGMPPAAQRILRSCA